MRLAAGHQFRQSSDLLTIHPTVCCCLPLQALFGELSLDVMVLTVLYSLAGLGIAIVNDFKSIEGDRKMGLQSLPVAFGVDTAKWICVSTIDVTQLGVAAYLYAGLHQTTYAAVLLGLILPQVGGG